MQPTARQLTARQMNTHNWADYSFEDYMDRPVYVAQVVTAQLACNLGGPNIRVVAAYRTPATKAFRVTLARIIKSLKKMNIAFVPGKNIRITDAVENGFFRDMADRIRTMSIETMKIKGDEI
mgnify:CR=1 FL=1|jgi:hypothetical protein